MLKSPPMLTTVALGSIAVGIVVIVLKFAAWWLTGSVALFSDAVESVVNVATAAAAYAAIRVGQRPPDANHPYGHHKAEYFSVILVGVLIIVAAISIFSAAWSGFRDPHPIDAPAVGIAVTVLATVLNGAWSWYLTRVGRRDGSPALAADGAHLFTDVLTSIAVVAGVLLVVATGILVLDSIVAAGVAIVILIQGWQVTRVSIAGLMDEAVPPEELEAIRKIISENAEGALEAHDIRTRAAGRMTFIEFHLVVPGAMPVSRSHDICDRIERALRAEVRDALISIHVEPEEKAKHTGVVVV